MTKKIAPYNKSCPKCQNPCAFEGFNHIQCPNDSCSNYSESQKTFVADWEKEQEKYQNSFAPINPECLDDVEEQHEEIAKSLRRLYQGYYNYPAVTPPTTTTNNNQTPVKKDVSIDNFSTPTSPQPDEEYYDEGDYLFNADQHINDDFDVY